MRVTCQLNALKNIHSIPKLVLLLVTLRNTAKAALIHHVTAVENKICKDPSSTGDVYLSATMTYVTYASIN